MWAALFSSDAHLLGLQVSTFLLRPQMAFSLCVHTPGVSPFSYKDSSLIGLGTPRL